MATTKAAVRKSRPRLYSFAALRICCVCVGRGRDRAMCYISTVLSTYISTTEINAGVCVCVHMVACCTLAERSMVYSSPELTMSFSEAP